MGEKEIDPSMMRAMEKFQRSPDRILKANAVFADFMENLCTPDTIPIFIGGAGHPVELYAEDHLYDKGIQGRVKQGISVLLTFSPTIETIQMDAAYANTERHLQGTYNYNILTNKKAIYKEAFNSYPGIKDKMTLLIDLLHSGLTQNPLN